LEPQLPPLLAAVPRLEHALATAQASLTACESERDRLAQALAASETARGAADSAGAEGATQRAALDEKARALSERLDRALAERDAAHADIATLNAEKEAVVAESERLLGKIRRREGEKAVVEAELEAARAEAGRAGSEIGEAEARWNGVAESLRGERDALGQRIKQLEKEFSEQHDAAARASMEAMRARATLNDEISTLRKERLRAFFYFLL
jgi:chromosome segregation ATPase